MIAATCQHVCLTGIVCFSWKPFFCTTHFMLQSDTGHGGVAPPVAACHGFQGWKSMESRFHCLGLCLSAVARQPAEGGSVFSLLSRLNSRLRSRSNCYDVGLIERPSCEGIHKKIDENSNVSVLTVSRFKCWIQKPTATGFCPDSEPK